MPSSWKRVLLKSRNSKGRGSWKLKEDVQKAFYKYMAEKDRSEETGRRFFPHCSEVVDKRLDCDWPDASLLEFGAPEEQKLKRDRFTELKADVQKAFCKDMAYDNLSGLPPSSSAFNKYMAEHNRSGMPTSSASSN